jgi:hypothetical protein
MIGPLDSTGWPIVTGARVYVRERGIRGEVLLVSGDAVTLRCFRTGGERTIRASSCAVQRGKSKAQETLHAIAESGRCKMPRRPVRSGWCR